MSPRNFPSSNPSSDFDRAIDQILRRLSDLEAGKHRAPGSSFGVPFILTNGSVSWSLGIDANGRLIATNLATSAVTILA